MPEVKTMTGLLSEPTVRQPTAATYQAVQYKPADTQWIGKAGDQLIKSSIYAQKAYEEMQETKRVNLTNQYNEEASEFCVGKNGLFHKKGAAVVNGINGQGYSEYGEQQLQRIADRLVSELPEDQREQAMKSLEGAKAQWVMRLQAHEGAEYEQYKQDTYKTSSALAKQNVTLGGDTKSAYETIYKANRNLAYQRGVAVGTPNGDALVRAQTQADMSSALMDKVKLDLADGRVSQAVSTFAEGQNEGWFTASDLVTARALVDAAKEQQEIDFGTQQVTQVLDADFTMERVIGRNLGLAPDSASDEVVQAAIQSSGGNTRMTLAILMYGEKEVTTAVSRAAEVTEKSGAQTTWLDLIGPDRKDEIEKKYKQVYTDQKSWRQPTVGDIRRMVDLKYPYASETVKNGIASGVATRLQNEAAERAQRQEDTMSAVLTSISETGNMGGVDLSDLTGEQYAAVQRFMDRQARGDDTSDYAFLFELQNSPHKLKNMSNADFLSLRGYLSAEAFKELDMQRSALLGVKALPDSVSMDTVNLAVNEALVRMGLEIKTTDDAGKAQMVVMRKIARETIQRIQNTKGKPLTQQESIDAVQNALGRTVATEAGFWSAAKNVPFAKLKASDLSSGTKKVLQAYMGQTVDTPTAAQYMSTFYSAMFDVTEASGNVTEAAKLPEVVRLRELCEKKYNRYLSDAAAVRIYLMTQNGDYRLRLEEILGV